MIEVDTSPVTYFSQLDELHFSRGPNKFLA